MGDDTGRAGNPSIPIHPSDCFDQADFTASHPIPSYWVGGTVCGGEGGELCVYARGGEAGNNGASTRLYLNRATNVARTTPAFGLEVLAGPPPLELRRASEVNGCGDLND